MHMAYKSQYQHVMGLLDLGLYSAVNAGAWPWSWTWANAYNEALTGGSGTGLQSGNQTGVNPLNVHQRGPIYNFLKFYFLFKFK